jgi:hypothetical protein
MKTVTYNENEWRLVPVVATHEMCSAPDSVWHPEAKIIWRQMLEAAPQPGEVVGEAVAVRYPDGKNIDGTQHYVYYGLPRHQPGHGAEELYVHPQPDAARDADAARWRHVRSTAFREFDSEGMWLRFAAIRHYDGPSDRLNERFVDSLVDAAMAAGRGEVG